MKNIKSLLIGAGALVIGGWIVYMMISNIEVAQEPQREYILNLDMTDRQRVEDGVVILRHRVNTNASNTYDYHYWISYEGKGTHLYVWDVLSRSLGSEVIVELSPNSNHEFILSNCESPPKIYMGRTEIFKREIIGTTITWKRTDLQDKKMGPIPRLAESK